MEILEEGATVGVENLESVSEDVLEVVSAVVEEVIEIASEEELTEEQVEVVQEVLQLDEAEEYSTIAREYLNSAATAHMTPDDKSKAQRNLIKAMASAGLLDEATEYLNSAVTAHMRPKDKS